MEIQLQIKMNEALYVRDPESSELGKKIIKEGLAMINERGFEDFTFKKLANKLGTTESSVYRYFENKHRLLTYITTWFWTWMEYQMVIHTTNIKDPKEKIDLIIKLFTQQVPDLFIMEHIDKTVLHQVVISEGEKSFLTKHVTEDNKALFFKPYKDLCHRIALVFQDFNPDYPYPHSLASTMIETAHHQVYFKDHLPRLTDFGGVKTMEPVADFLSLIVFSSLSKK